MRPRGHRSVGRAVDFGEGLTQLAVEPPCEVRIGGVDRVAAVQVAQEPVGNAVDWGMAFARPARQDSECQVGVLRASSRAGDGHTECPIHLALGEHVAFISGDDEAPLDAALRAVCQLTASRGGAPTTSTLQSVSGRGYRSRKTMLLGSSAAPCRGAGKH